MYYLDKLININECIQFIKRRLGYPSVSIELSDDQIAEIIKHETLMLFESIIPDVGKIFIRKGSKKYRVRRHLYWVIDPKDREVIAVQSVDPEQTELLANSYPYTVPIVNYYNIPELLLDMTKAHISMKFGKSLVWYQEDGKPQVWIWSSDGLSSRYLVTYTRSHAPDLSSINREYAMDFYNLALANSMIMIGNIRTKYGQITTPVGDLNINGSELLSNGQTLLQSTVEHLDKVKPTYCPMIVW